VSVTLPSIKDKKNNLLGILFFLESSRKEGGFLVEGFVVIIKYLHVGCLCAESVGFGCQRVSITKGGWITVSHKQTCKWTETYEVYDWFYYKDRDTKKITHLMDLEKYVVIKKWVIITEISKEDENNNISRLNVYSKHYVSRGPRVGEVGRSAGPSDGGDHIQVVVVLDVLDTV
jgi:hypothetical protein